MYLKKYIQLQRRHCVMQRNVAMERTIIPRTAHAVCGKSYLALLVLPANGCCILLLLVPKVVLILCNLQCVLPAMCTVRVFLVLAHAHDL